MEIRRCDDPIHSGANSSILAIRVSPTHRLSKKFDLLANPPLLFLDHKANENGMPSSSSDRRH
jgi:hypothetical protein